VSGHETQGKWRLPVCAATLALAYLLAAIVLPGALPAVVGASAVASCALVVARRQSGTLALTLAAIGIWLAIGLAGAWLPQENPLHGLLWITAVLFLMPLLVIPWLYALTSSAGHGPRATNNGPR
jgi:hypothetical protein